MQKQRLIRLALGNISEEDTILLRTTDAERVAKATLFEDAKKEYTKILHIHNKVMGEIRSRNSIMTQALDSVIDCGTGEIFRYVTEEEYLSLQ